MPTASHVRALALTRPILLLTLLTALACGGQPAQRRSAAAPAPPAAPAPEAPALPGDDALAAKLDLYVRDCLNAFSERANDSHARYLQWVDPATGPTGKERHVYGLYTLNFGPDRCRDAVQEAAALPPKSPELETAARIYAEALAELAPRIDEADAYYEGEDYRDDAFGRGKAMHGPLMDAWERFQDADAALSALVGKSEVEVVVRALERARVDDPERALVLDAYLTGRTMARTAAQTPVDASGKLVLDVEAFAAQVDAFAKATKALDDHARATGWDDRVLDEAEDLRDAAKDMLRHARDGKAFSSTERNRIGTSAGWMTDASPDAVVNEYDDFVSAYNSLIDSPQAQSSANRRSWRAEPVGTR